MKAKLTINGKEFEVEISEEQAQALTETKKKTGYERVAQGEIYYIEGDYGEIFCREGRYADKHYEDANYYSDRTVAKNNARADKLYRQLRRFAVEHREERLDWKDNNQEKYRILYNHSYNRIEVDSGFRICHYATIYFDSREYAQLAIDTFHDELIWYFTEYKDSL